MAWLVLMDTVTWVDRGGAADSATSVNLPINRTGQRLYSWANSMDVLIRYIIGKTPAFDSSVAPRTGRERANAAS